MNIFQDQASFMNAAGQETKQYNEDQANLYAKLIAEESSEFIQEIWNYSPDDPVDSNEHTIKEACDVIVVAVGYLISVLGVEGAQQVWNIVHENNIAKTIGGVAKREDGKILKGDTNKAERKAKMMSELRGLLNDNS